jgi:hypothetical protein
MNEYNPYEATKAPLIDAEQATDRRPLVVAVALGILWTLSALVLLSTFAVSWKVITAFNLAGNLVFAMMAGLAIVVGMLLVQTGKGRNWARVGTLAWIVALIAMGVLSQNYSSYPIWALVGALIPPALLASAAVLLCVPRSNAWFKARRS